MKNKCEEKAESEREIEIKLKEHEEGIATFDQVQDIANKAVNVKYKAEVTLQDYKQDVEYLNAILADSEKRYKP